jgi:hypothetical protein
MCPAVVLGDEVVEHFARIDCAVELYEWEFRGARAKSGFIRESACTAQYAQRLCLDMLSGSVRCRMRSMKPFKRPHD